MQSPWSLFLLQQLQHLLPDLAVVVAAAAAAVAAVAAVAAAADVVLPLPSPVQSKRAPLHNCQNGPAYDPAHTIERPSRRLVSPTVCMTQL